MEVDWLGDGANVLHEAARLMRVDASERPARNGCVIAPARGWVDTQDCRIEALRGTVFGRPSPSLMVRVDRGGAIVPLIAQGAVEPDPFSSKGIRAVGAGMVAWLDSDLELASESVEFVSGAFLARTQSLVAPEALSAPEPLEDDRHETVERLRARREREHEASREMRTRAHGWHRAARRG